MPSSPLSINLFGPLTVSVRGQPMCPLRSRPAEWLLALLVLRHGRAISRAALALTLWPESHHERALLNLRRVLLELRQALGPEAERLRSPTRDTLLLDLTGAEVDLLRFDAAIAAGEESSLQEGVTLYRGPLLEGCSEEWILGEREARREACLQALERLADLRLRESGEEEAVRNRHLACFLRLAQEAGPSLRGPAAEAAFGRLDTEIGNLRGALAWAQTEAAPPEVCARFVAALWPYWQRHGSLFEGCSLVQAAHARASELHREALAFFLRKEPEDGEKDWDGIVWSLRELALCGMSEEEAQKAARLLGAAAKLREVPECPMHHWDEAIAAVRAVLGEEAFSRAFEAGCALSCELAVTLALEGA